MNDLRTIPAALACVADPSRYRVLSLLVEGDFCVTEIAARIGLSQSCTTRHLQTLQRAGVLTRTRAGKRVLFRIREGDPELARLIELILVRRPLESRPATPRRRAPAARARVDRAWVPNAHRQRAAAAGGPAPNEITMSATASGDVITDAPGATESPTVPEHVAESQTEAAPMGAAGELEDYLL